MSFFYKNGRTAVVDGSLIWRTDNIKAVLLNLDFYTPNQATDQYLSSIPVSARVSTSANLVGKTNNGGVINATGTKFPGTAAGTSCAAIALYKDTGSPTTSPLLAYIDDALSGLPVVTDGADINVTWNTGADKIGVLSGDSTTPEFSLLNYAGAVEIFDAADLIGADGSVVTLWANEVSGGNDLANSSGFQRPVLKSSVAGLHNLPAVLFTSGQFLIVPDTTGTNPFNGSFAAYIVCLPIDFSLAYNSLIASSTGTEEYSIMITNAGKSAIYDVDNGVPVFNYDSSGAQTYTPTSFVMSIRSEDGTRLRVEKNGNVDVDINPGVLNGVHKTDWQLFGSTFHGRYLHGYTPLIAIYNQIPSDLDHAIIVNALKSRFGIS